MIDYEKCPSFLTKYLFYLETIKGRSRRTCEAYYVDLRFFLRFMKRHKKLVARTTDLSEIQISDLTIDFIKTISLSDIYDFLHFANQDCENNSKTRARKTSSIRGFFKFLTTKEHLLDDNPVKELEVPSVKKSLPKYLTLEQSLQLLDVVDGPNKERDFCILTLFLNCGMRLSELVGINLSDVRDNTLRLLGKGNKERIVYLNNACENALNSYLNVRNSTEGIVDKKAMFIGRGGRRLGARRVEKIVEENLRKSGLGQMGYSVHKLRHTAATLMYQHGNVDIRVLKEVLGHENLGTTEIYTHVSSSNVEKAISNNPLANVKPRKKDTKTPENDESTSD